MEDAERRGEQPTSLLEEAHPASVAGLKSDGNNGGAAVGTDLEAPPPARDASPARDSHESVGERVDWRLGLAITLCGLLALAGAGYLESADQGFWTAVLVEVGAAIFLFTVLTIAASRVVREVNRKVADVREAVERLEKSTPQTAGLTADRLQVQADHSELASALAARGRAVARRDAALKRLHAELEMVASEVTDPQVGLSAVFRPSSDVHRWHPGAFGKGQLGGEPTPPCDDGGPAQDRGHELVISPHGKARVEWVAAVGARLCPSGPLHYAVGYMIEPVNPMGRDAPKTTNRFMNEQLDRRYGFRSRCSVDADSDDHDRLVEELARELRQHFAQGLAYFYELSSWADSFEEYDWYSDGSEQRRP